MTTNVKIRLPNGTATIEVKPQSKIKRNGSIVTVDELRIDFGRDDSYAMEAAIRLKERYSIK